MFTPLHDIVGDVAAAVPSRSFPCKCQGIRSNVVSCREPRWIGTIGDLDFNNSCILTKFVFGCNPVGTTVKFTCVTNSEDSMSVFDFDVIVTSRFDGFTFSYPCDLRSWEASEWDLDNNVFAFVEVGGVTEPWRRVQFWCSWKKENVT